MQAVLQRLPSLQRQVLFLHFVNGLHCTEIVFLLGKRDGAVRVLLVNLHPTSLQGAPANSYGHPVITVDSSYR